MSLLFEKYEISNKKLGSGASAEVYEGKNIETSECVAIKIISLVRRSMNMVNMEIEITKNLNHENIVKYYCNYGSKTPFGPIYIILELCDAGTLMDLIEHNKKYSNDLIKREQNTVKYLTQLRNGISFLRSNGIMHRDLKPANILLKKNNPSVHIDYNNYSDYTIKIADFGLAREEHPDVKTLYDTFCGSPLYTAPEILLNNKYDSTIDLWSFGIIMYELLVGQPPYGKLIKLSALTNKVKNSFDTGIFRLSHINNYSCSCVSLLNGLLQINFKNRMDWDSFFVHVWFDYDPELNTLATSLNKSATDTTAPKKSCQLSKMKWGLLSGVIQQRDYIKSEPIPIPPTRGTIRGTTAAYWE